jgi:hypothetical protein
MLRKLLLLGTFLFIANIYSQDFTSIWNTANLSSGSSADNQITIPTNPIYTYNYNDKYISLPDSSILIGHKKKKNKPIKVDI